MSVETMGMLIFCLAIHHSMPTLVGRHAIRDDKGRSVWPGSNMNPGRLMKVLRGTDAKTLIYLDLRRTDDGWWLRWRPIWRGDSRHTSHSFPRTSRYSSSAATTLAYCVPSSNRS